MAGCRIVAGVVAGAVMLAACGGSGLRDSEANPSAANPSVAAPPRAAVAATTSLSGTPEAQVIDSFDLASGILDIPLVQVGTAFYRDVRVTLGRIVSIGTASSTSGVFDRFDTATGLLTIPVVRVGGQLYRNVVITPGPILSVGGPVASHSVPTDLAQVSYPQSYVSPTTDESQVNTDPCRLDIDHVTYPATWLGSYPLPATDGAPLKPGIQRGVMLKDVGLQPGNPAFIGYGSPGAPAGCEGGDLRAELDRTIARLKALGSDFLTVAQWHWATSRTDGSWTFTSAEDTPGAMTDADLAYLAQKAHAAGLKVLMRNQIQGFYPAGHPEQVSRPPATAENLQKWFGAWHEYIAERSSYFQSIGIDMWELGCGTCIYLDTGLSDEWHGLFASEYAKALDTMKQVFTGETLISDNPWLWNTPQVASKVDIIQVHAGAYNRPADLTQNLTVPYYRSLLAPVQGSINVYDGFGKKILLVYHAQSRDNFFTYPGYMEETACTPGFHSFDTTGTACIQRATATDFSLQAIVHQATLEAINALTTQKSTLMVEVSDYWVTDSLMPFTAFPNIATSIRNKPAEGIVKAWFAR